MIKVDVSEYPASFSNWVARRTDKLRNEGRAEWQPLPVREDAPKIAALVHVYYQDLVPEIVSRLANIPVPFDVIFTNASGEPLEIDITRMGGHVRDIRILDVPNHGRDILPMISVVNAGLLEEYELVVKVHTKKSPWRETQAALPGDGDQWRATFLEQLLGGRDHIERILSSFIEDPGIGLVTADESLLGPEYWSSNRELTEELLKRLELEQSSSLHFASGSMYWIRGFLLNGFRALDLTHEDFEPESGQNDGTTAHAIERLIGILSNEAGFALREYGSLERPVLADSWQWFSSNMSWSSEARVVPFYLPQFHAFPENDQWWGTGFTEWSNVASAKPMFLGHRQPNLPSDLGFYDLLTPRVRPNQYELAREHGVEGFMYYYYWFEGKKLMQTPVEDLLASDFKNPFCLMWANENWTRRWDGLDEEVLIAQDYDKVPASQFIDDIHDLITDERYIKIDGMPVLAIYRISQIPDYLETVKYWRKRAIDFGLPGLVLLAVDLPSAFDGLEAGVGASGLDGVLEFPPHNRRAEQAPEKVNGIREDFEGAVLSYRTVVEHSESDLFAGVEQGRYPGVLVCFDNTARRQLQPSILYGANPFTFRRWLRTAVLALHERPFDQRLIFINAWNEWAEGAVLEPSQRFGKSYLLAIKSALNAPGEGH